MINNANVNAEGPDATGYTIDIYADVRKYILQPVCVKCVYIIMGECQENAECTRIYGTREIVAHLPAVLSQDFI